MRGHNSTSASRGPSSPKSPSSSRRGSQEGGGARHADIVVPKPTAHSNRPSVGKIGASILTTLGHPEWIATSEQEYVEKAVALASDPHKLSTIRQNLRAEMEASPLMDQKGFVRELEEAYQAMWKIIIKNQKCLI